MPRTQNPRCFIDGEAVRVGCRIEGDIQHLDPSVVDQRVADCVRIVALNSSIRATGNWIFALQYCRGKPPWPLKRKWWNRVIALEG